MKIHLDECIPRKFKEKLVPHDCRSVSEEGWAGTKNGEHLALAEESGFQVFLTIDRGIECQHNLTRRHIPIVLIASKSYRLADPQPQAPEILRVLESVQSGQLLKVGLGTKS